MVDKLLSDIDEKYFDSISSHGYDKFENYMWQINLAYYIGIYFLYDKQFTSNPLSFWFWLGALSLVISILNVGFYMICIREHLLKEILKANRNILLNSYLSTNIRTIMANIDSLDKPNKHKTWNTMNMLRIIFTSASISICSTIILAFIIRVIPNIRVFRLPQFSPSEAFLIITSSETMFWIFVLIFFIVFCGGIVVDQKYVRPKIEEIDKQWKE